MVYQLRGQKIGAAEGQQQKERHPSQQSSAPNIPNCKRGTTVSIAQCMCTLVGKSSQHHDPVEVQELSRILI